MLFSGSDLVSNDAVLMMRAYALTGLFMSLTAGLISQLVKKYSMILTLSLCGALELFGTFALLAGLSGSAELVTGISLGIEIAVCCVLPFVMIPIASYSQSFTTPEKLSYM